MEPQQIIATILGIYSKLLHDKIAPKTAESHENGELFTWMLDTQTKLEVDQLDKPLESHFKVINPLFTLILREDSAAQKYHLDADDVKDDTALAQWLGAQFMQNYQNYQTLLDEQKGDKEDE